MIPHYPEIAPDGRRCNVIIRKGRRCNLLEEEHPPLVFVAILDTGGISYSDRTIIATGESAEDAQRAAWDQLRGRRRTVTTHYGTVLRSPADATDYYGIRTYGPIALGTATED